MPIIKERMFLPPFKGRVGVGSLYGNLYPSPALPSRRKGDASIKHLLLIFDNSHFKKH